MTPCIVFAPVDTFEVKTNPKDAAVAIQRSVALPAHVGPEHQRAAVAKPVKQIRGLRPGAWVTLRRWPWKDTSPMNERVKFVAATLAAEETFGELCEPCLRKWYSSSLPREEGIRVGGRESCW